MLSRHSDNNALDQSRVERAERGQAEADATIQRYGAECDETDLEAVDVEETELLLPLTVGQRLADQVGG